MERHPSDQEQRLVVLFLIGRFGRVSDLQLLQFLFEYDIMRYFDMMIALSELCAQGQCLRTGTDSGSFYRLTDAGRESVSLFSRKIPASVMELMEEHIPAWQERFRREQETPAEYRQTRRGEYLLTAGVTEQDMQLMRLSVSLPDEELARTFAARWPACAGRIYHMIFEILSGEPS